MSNPIELVQVPGRAAVAPAVSAAVSSAAAPPLAAAAALGAALPTAAGELSAVDVPESREEVPLPKVYRGALDADGVRALFADLAALPDGVEVRLKAGAELRAEVGPVDLARARDLLLDAMVLGVQLIYRHEGQTWFDTVMRLPDGFEVVRMAQ